MIIVAVRVADAGVSKGAPSIFGTHAFGRTFRMGCAGYKCFALLIRIAVAIRRAISVFVARRERLAQTRQAASIPDSTARLGAVACGHALALGVTLLTFRAFLCIAAAFGVCVTIIIRCAAITGFAGICALFDIRFTIFDGVGPAGAVGPANSYDTISAVAALAICVCLAAVGGVAQALVVVAKRTCRAIIICEADTRGFT